VKGTADAGKRHHANPRVEGGLASGNIGLVTGIGSCPGMDYCSLATA
jgi:sulfite reductase beta subunit-like hemoprotein